MSSPAVDLTWFLPPLDRAIRARYSEHTTLPVHDALFATIKGAIRPFRDAIEASLAEDLGFDQVHFAKLRLRRSIAMLRSLLDQGARERDLQNGLMDSGLLPAINCRAVQEVSMEPTDQHRGMRMDLVLQEAPDGATQIIELKRGSHLLLVRRGTLDVRLSKPFDKAIKQIKDYGIRLASDSAGVAKIEVREGVPIRDPILRLVAGRRLSDANEYQLLTSVESEEAASGLQLQLYTWDGYLAELERMVD